MSRLIITIENFFASVEAGLNHRINGRPFAVSNGEFIVGISPEARKFTGLHAGITEALALEKFPELLCLRGNMARYVDFSLEIRKRFEEISYHVETRKPGKFALQIDACPVNNITSPSLSRLISQMLDGKNFRGGKAKTFRIADIASRSTPLNTVKFVDLGEEENFMSELPLKSLPLTNLSIAKLKEMGCVEVGDIRKIPLSALQQLLGPETSRAIRYCRGEITDHEEKIRKLTRKIRISNPDKTPESDFADAMVSMITELIERSLNAVSVFIGLTYADGVMVARTLKLSPTRDEIELGKAVRFLLTQLWKRRTRLKEGILEMSVKPDNFQRTLFEDVRRERIALSMHAVRENYGQDSVRYASMGGG